MKNTLYQLWRESTIIQGLMALGSMGVVLYLYATSQAVPTELLGIVLTILGFYFGSKSQQKQNTKGD